MPIRFNNVFETNVSGGRTDLVNDIPALEVLKSDILVLSIAIWSVRTDSQQNLWMGSFLK